MHIGKKIHCQEFKNIGSQGYKKAISLPLFFKNWIELRVFNKTFNQDLCFLPKTTFINLFKQNFVNAVVGTDGIV